MFVLANGSGSPADVSWTAYTGRYEPLPPGEVTSYGGELPRSLDAAVLWSTDPLAGAALVVLGLLVLTGLGVGRRAAGPIARRRAERTDERGASACRGPGVSPGKRGPREAESYRNVIVRNPV